LAAPHAGVPHHRRRHAFPQRQAGRDSRARGARALLPRALGGARPGIRGVDETGEEGYGIPLVVAAERDDELLSWRSEFPALETSVYMISHSLGAMPRAAADHLAEFGRLWVERSITAWEEWLPEVDRAAARVGRIIGAPAGSVIMLPNVSHAQAVVASCLEYDGARNKVVYTDMNFPSVSYVWMEERRRGARVEIVKSPDGVRVPLEGLLAAIDERTVIVPISHVLFRSSFIQDARAIVQRAHDVGATVLLDCYQSAGTVPFDVTAMGVDMACGGSVKWLCGGPGAGYLYVRQDLRAKLKPRVT